jgi:hypothetical protein
MSDVMNSKDLAALLGLASAQSASTRRPACW